jgi:single-stranded-DNA-specific exonuclease
MSFKYELLGKVGFGNEINDILKLKGVEDINSFLNPTEKNIENELLFDNIIRARDLYDMHIKLNSVIAIVVDPDVDGYTSASSIYQYTERINDKVKIHYIIHEQKKHGLEDVLSKIIETNCNLLIVPDAGSNDVEQIIYLKK